MKLLNFYPAALLALLLLAACESATYVDTDKVIAEKVQEQLDEYRKVNDQRCRDRVLTEAGRIADSMIMVRARLMKDTIQRPLRPTRPEKPTVLTLEDSLALKPLIKKD